MSVINDMLRDLEQRKAPEREAIVSVDVARLVEPQQNKRLIYWLLIALVFGAAVSFGIWMVQQNPKSVPAELMVLPIEHAPDETVATEAGVVLQASPVSVASPEQIRVEADSNAASPMIIEDKVDKSHAAKQTLHEPEVAAVPELSIVSEKPVIAIKEQKRAVSATRIGQSAGARQKNTPEIDEAEIVEVPTPETRRIVLSPKALDQQNAEAAVTLFKQGNDRKAYRLLFDFVAEHDYDLKSRVVLAGYLLQDGRIAEAGDILVTAPIDVDPELRQIKARWLLASGDETMAMHTLSSNLPELETHPDYYALLASYYQQFGYPEKAAEVYSLLVQYDASAANWWAGLGVALDSAERFSDAAQAYRRALQLPGLNRPVLEFINARMQALRPK